MGGQTSAASTQVANGTPDRLGGCSPGGYQPGDFEATRVGYCSPYGAEGGGGKAVGFAGGGVGGGGREPGPHAAFPDDDAQPPRQCAAAWAERLTSFGTDIDGGYAENNASTNYAGSQLSLPGSEGGGSCDGGGGGGGSPAYAAAGNADRSHDGGRSGGYQPGSDFATLPIGVGAHHGPHGGHPEAPPASSGGRRAADAGGDGLLDASPLTTPCVQSWDQQQPEPRQPHDRPAGPLNSEARLREAWEVGSIVEAFSASAGRWSVARVTTVRQAEGSQVLTVKFYLDDECKTKTVYRNDKQLAPMGTHTSRELPPGFQMKASQSRPGQWVALDATTGVKYASADLAWKVHFDRIGQLSLAGMDTIADMSGANAAAASSAPAAVGTRENRSSSRHVPAPVPSSGPAPVSPVKQAMTLAELQASGPEVAPVERRRSAGEAAAAATAAAIAAASRDANGKIGLPSFGERGSSTNQAAYLEQLGAGLPAGGRPFMKQHPMAVMQEMSHQGMPDGHPMAAMQEMSHQGMPDGYGEMGGGGGYMPNYRHARVCNREVMHWQEDPFSQWRR